jgi:hypothetical protein
MVVNWISGDEAAKAGDREEQVLLEQSPDHYPEFGRFIRAEMDRAGGQLYFQGKSGTVYSVSNAPIPGANRLAGIQIAMRTTLQGATITQDKVDLDLWPFFEWLVTGAGGDWTRDALRKTGAIYRIPGAPDHRESKDRPGE